MNKYQKLFKEFQKESKSQFVPEDVNDNILLFDGLNTFIRSFGANPASNEHGDHVGGLTGFLYSVGKTVRDLKPSRCIIVFDGVGGSKRRKKIFKDYKGNRANKTKLRRHDHIEATLEQEQEDMRHQFARLVEYLDCLPVTFLAMDGIEADDTIAYITHYYRNIAKKITIVSTDRDFYQLVDEQIQVWSPIKKKMYDAKEVHDEFGVWPQNFVVYRTFIGDGSDNIPGISGIGPKTVLKQLPELKNSKLFTVDDLKEKCLSESTNKTYKKTLDNWDVIDINHRLMDLKLLNISGTTTSTIRSIIEGPIPNLNKNEFRKLFSEDALWAVMKNMPDWLNNTWLSLNAYALQTHTKV